MFKYVYIFIHIIINCHLIMSQQLDNATEDTMNNYTKMRSIIMCLINSLGAQTPNQKITVYILDGENIQNIMANCHYSFQCQEVAGSDGTIYSEIKKLIASNNYYDTVPFYIIVNKKPQINTERSEEHTSELQSRFDL